MLICKKCGKYNSPSEYPEEERANFIPDLCYDCYRAASIDQADSKEDEPEDLDNDEDGLLAVDEAEKNSVEGDDNE